MSGRVIDPAGLDRCVICQNAFEYDADPDATAWWHTKSAAGEAAGFICKTCAAELPPRVDEDELNDARGLAAALDKGPVLALNLDASQAFIVASALQLAMRHPAMKDDSSIAQELRAVVQAIGLGLGPNVANLLERGYNSDEDVPQALDERHALYSGWVAALALKNGVAVEVVDDKEGNHTNRLRLPMPADNVSIELVVPYPPDDWTLDPIEYLAQPGSRALIFQVNEDGTLEAFGGEL